MFIRNLKYSGMLGNVKAMYPILIIINIYLIYSIHKMTLVSRNRYPAGKIFIVHWFLICTVHYEQTVNNVKKYYNNISEFIF